MWTVSYVSGTCDRVSDSSEAISPGILIAQAIVFSYFIATTETMINQHDAKVSGEWGIYPLFPLFSNYYHTLPDITR